MNVNNKLKLIANTGAAGGGGIAVGTIVGIAMAVLFLLA
jgi:hypothetical protein